MSFLLDTNVISELVKKPPTPSVIEWLNQADEDQLYISVVTLAELRYGIDKMPDGARRRGLKNWLIKHLPERFGGRIISINPEIAAAWGRFMALQQKLGRAPDAMDAAIAATAHQNKLSVVTRNVKDFGGFEMNVLNPWELK